MSTPRTEYRIFKSEVRASKGDKPQISGYAAVFNTQTDLGYIREKIAPGAFKNAIAENQDVKCLFNHDPNKVLGRTKSGTLRLSEDNTGLKYECDIDPTTSIGKDVHAHISRGDVDQCSFGFIVRKESMDHSGDMPVRTIEECDLFDVSPVTYPAYPTTSVEARSNSAALAKFRDDPDDDEDVEEDRDMCSCRCRACFDGECNECEKHINDCQADNCDHEQPADDSTPDDNNGGGDSGNDDDDERSKITFTSGENAGLTARADAVTKKVDGEDLSADDFIYVGDPKKTATWSLPWHFSSEAKTKSHLRNALARFSQTDNIPAAEKPAAYKKLVSKCKAHGVDVAEEKKSAGMDVEKAKRLTYLASL